MAFKTIKCPHCKSQISVRVPDPKSNGKAAIGIAGGGAGAGMVGLLAEWGVEFPGPLSVAIGAGIITMFCQKFAPEILEMLGNGKK